MADIDTSITYFHGCGFTEPSKLIPSVLRPFYITENFHEAKEYSHGSTTRIYALFLSNKAKAFGMTSDVLKLKGGRTYFSDETIELLDDLYGEIDFNCWMITHNPVIRGDAFDFLAGVLENELHRKVPTQTNYFITRFKKEAPKMMEPIHHMFADEMPKIRGGSFEKLCIEIFRRLKLSVPLSTLIQGKSDYKVKRLLMAMLMADTLQAIADRKYPYDFMTYRRIIYQAAVDMGYSIVIDTNTTGDYGNCEYVILSKDAIDLIMNRPFVYPDDNSPDKLGKVMKRLMDLGDAEKKIGRKDFEKLLKGE